MQGMNALAVSICALVAVTRLLYGQGNATIVGVIIDASGAAGPGSRGTTLNEGTGRREIATSDSAGRYNFSRLAVGNYRIEVSAAGFKTDTRSGINLTAEQVLTANFTLEVGDVKESVEVTGAVTALETAASSVRSVVRRELIEDLPLNGRNALQLQTLLPGAINQTGARVSLSEEGGIAVNGARGNDNNVLLDGGHNNDPYNGTPP